MTIGGSGATTSGRLVTLVEDDEECAAGCMRTLDRHGWSCAWYATGGAALDAARAGGAMPLVLMDLELPGEITFEIMVALRRTAAKPALVAFTSHVGDDFLFGALRAGAVGYLLKYDPIEALPERLDEVWKGGSPMSPGIARRVLGSFHGSDGSTPAGQGLPAPSLTVREREVIELLARGHSNSSCSQILGLALDTIRTHVRHSYEKLHASTKAGAVAEAFRQGLVR